jgi:hypothetical protein
LSSAGRASFLHKARSPAASGAEVALPAQRAPETARVADSTPLPRRQESFGARRNGGSNLHGISVSTRLMAVVGDAAAGIILSQVLYWCRRTPDLADRDGWIFKTSDELQQETGMSWKVQRRARQILLAAGWIEERKLTMPARLEFRLHLAALGRALAERSEMQLDTPLTWAQLSDRSDSSFDRLLGRSFLFHGVLTQKLPLTAAVLASRLECRPQAPTGTMVAQPLHWLRLQRDAWRQETGLTRDQWQTARKTLASVGVLIERGHNFPRRVDLAVDPQRMAELIAQCNALARTADEQRSRQEWEKQAGGNGHRPIPPSLIEETSTVSPDPAVIDRPVPPITIARNSRYMDKQLPTNHNYPGAHAQPWAGLDQSSWRGWGLIGLVISPSRLAWSIAAVVPRPATTTTQESGETANTAGDGMRAVSALDATPAIAINPAAELHWPKALQQVPESMGLAMNHLAGLSPRVQQSVLDEIVFMEHHAMKPVRNHLGLLRYLCTMARDGTFTPEGAHRIAKMRADRLAHEAAQRQEAERRAAKQVSPAAAGMEEEGEGLRRFKALAQKVKRRAAG